MGSLPKRPFSIVRLPAPLSRAMVLVLLCLLAMTASAKDDPEKRQQALNKEIGTLVKELEAEKNRYSDLEKKLVKLERQIQTQNRSLKSVDEKIQRSSQRLAALRAQKQDQEANLSAQQAQLAAQLRAAWIAGNQERLQLWLGGGDMKMFGPVLTWYEYLNQRRVGTVVDLANDVEELANTENELKAADDALRQLRNTEQENVAKLDAIRKQRRTLLASSQARIQAEQDQLAKLKKEQAELTALIKRLKEIAAKAPPPSKPVTPFAKLTGKLRWPVPGKILHDYGAPRADGRLKWNGVTIKAKRGAKVRSIADGEVIFADWLGRLGLLMIVDHGDQYLSLYGHNEALYKKPGDKVTAGEVLSSVGDSGGRLESALYFEIRKGAKFRNPHQWCKKPAH